MTIKHKTTTSRVVARAQEKAGRSEWRFVLICAVLMLLVSVFLYAFGYLIAPEGRVFTGIITRTPDSAQYLSWLRGFTTANLIDNDLTPEPNEAIFFNLLWWLLAKVVALTGLNPLLVLNVFQSLCIIAFAAALFWFISLILSERVQRRFAFLVAFFGGGLGWMWVVLKYATSSSDVLFPRDLYTVEPNSFLAMIAFSHFPISAALIMVVFGLFMRGIETRKWKYALWAGLAALVLGWEHAYDILLIYAILGVFTLVIWARDGFSWRPALYLGFIFVVSVWSALYSVYITRAFPVWKAVLAQFDNAGAWTPDPLHLLVLMGLPFIIALLGFDGLVPLRRRSHRDLFLRVWFGANLFLVYAPFNFQIHYLNGWQVPIAILATITVFMRLLPWLHERRFGRWLTRVLNPQGAQRAALGTLFAAVLLVNVYLLAWNVLVLKRLPHDNFLYTDEVAALNWLEAHVKSDDVIFSDQVVGQYIPFRTGARAFLAHWAMTKDLYDKQDAIKRFFDPATPDSYRVDLFREYSIDYVIYGVDERAAGAYDPAAAPFLTPCFTAPQASVFCVDAARLAAAP